MRPQQIQLIYTSRQSWCHIRSRNVGAITPTHSDNFAQWTVLVYVRHSRLPDHEGKVEDGSTPRELIIVHVEDGGKAVLQGTRIRSHEDEERKTASEVVQVRLTLLA